MKPGPNFKMTKANKTILANIVDPQRRAEIKRGLIAAQLASEVRVKAERKGPSAPSGSRTTTGTSSVAE